MKFNLEQLVSLQELYLSDFRIPVVRWTDVVEVLIIAFLLYHILTWIKDTRAWALLRGVVVIAVFLVIAEVLGMSTILWIAQNVLSLAVIAIIVVLQPELRKALETLGRTNFFYSIFPFDALRSGHDTNISDKTISEIVKACVEMGKARTGALIVVQRSTDLTQYERTGIDVDAIVSNQLLINIFEHNTPLHDGAIIIRGNRVTSATCYLPLSDNMRLSKELGTRHRAGVGISEVTDALTLIVSEETGRISVTQDGVLESNLSAEQLREKLMMIQEKLPENKKKIWKGWRKDSEKV